MQRIVVIHSFSEAKECLLEGILSPFESKPMLVGTCDDIGNSTEYFFLGESCRVHFSEIRCCVAFLWRFFLPAFEIFNPVVALIYEDTVLFWVGSSSSILHCSVCYSCFTYCRTSPVDSRICWLVLVECTHGFGTAEGSVQCTRAFLFPF